MTIKHLFAGAFFLAGMALSGPGLAQEADAGEKSSARIVCELTGDCAAFEQEATQDKPESRRFAVGVPVPAARGTARAARKPAYAAVPARGGQSVARPARSRLIEDDVAVRIQPGRSDLAIGFALGSDRLTEAGLSQAQRLLDAVQSPSAKARRFEVVGHTDALGGRDFNLALSRRRAETVVRYLTDHGVDRARLDPRGYGFDVPLPGVSVRSPANRRVEIVRID